MFDINLIKIDLYWNLSLSYQKKYANNFVLLL